MTINAKLFWGALAALGAGTCFAFAMSLCGCGAGTPTPVIVTDAIRVDQDACKLVEDLGASVKALCPFGDGSTMAPVQVPKSTFYASGPIFIGCPSGDAGADQ